MYAGSNSHSISEVDLFAKVTTHTAPSPLRWRNPFFSLILAYFLRLECRGMEIDKAKIYCFCQKGGYGLLVFEDCKEDGWEKVLSH